MTDMRPNPGRLHGVNSSGPPAYRESLDGIVGELTGNLVNTLVAIPEILSPGDRALLQESLEDRLGRLGARDHERPRSAFVEMVRLCSRRRGGLAGLAASVELMARDDPNCREIRRLVEQLQALDTEPSLSEVWSPLRTALRELPLVQIEPVILQVTGGRMAMLPPYCDGGWSTFIHLVGQNGPQSMSIPPWMAFLELIRGRLDYETGDVLRRFMRSLAKEWECTADLEQVRAWHDGQMPSSTRTAILTIVLTPDPVDQESFTVYSVVAYSVPAWGGERTSPVRSDDIKAHRSELKKAVEAVVSRAEENWSARTTQLQIEFVLPLVLLNEPIEWWPKDSQTPLPPPLALYHSVVLRSFERMRKTAWHRVWMRRWERLNASVPGRLLWSPDPGRPDHLRRLEAQLTEDEDCVGIVLSAPPSPNAHEPQEMIVALRAGVPLILWNRRGDSISKIRELVCGMDDPQAIPEEIAQLRRRIERLEPGERDVHPGRELSVLWDNAGWGPGILSTHYE